jgi:hypothetical protein
LGPDRGKRACTGSRAIDRDSSADSIAHGGFCKAKMECYGPAAFIPPLFWHVFSGRLTNRRIQMADFQFETLPRSVEVPAQVAFPRTLEIAVAEAHQIYPLIEDAPPAGALLIFAGAIAFGVDGDPGEALNNLDVNDENAEVDEGEQRTVQLSLTSPEAEKLIVEGSASMAAMGNVYLSGNHGGVDVLPDQFGANVSNALTQPGDENLVLLSDVVAELGSQMNRMSYTASVLIVPNE